MVDRLEPTHSRHGQIEQDDVGLILGDERQCLDRVAGLADNRERGSSPSEHRTRSRISGESSTTSTSIAPTVSLLAGGARDRQT